MILSAAQTIPKRGNITENLNDHYRLTKLAAAHGSQVIVFPELSITGYEREEAANLSFTPNDQKLNTLKALAMEEKILIIAGAPVKLETGLCIGSFVLFPDGKTALYTKQFLHGGEEQFFLSGFDHNPAINLQNERISLAICADITNPLHPANAAKANCTIYIASLFYTPNGIPEGHRLLSEFAKNYAITVLMANYGGDSWGMASGGQSACWSDTGEMLANLDSSGEGLVILEKENGIWGGKTVKYD